MLLVTWRESSSRTESTHFSKGHSFFPDNHVYERELSYGQHDGSSRRAILLSFYSQCIQPLDWCQAKEGHTLHVRYWHNRWSPGVYAASCFGTFNLLQRWLSPSSPNIRKQEVNSPSLSTRQTDQSWHGRVITCWDDSENVSEYIFRVSKCD